MKYLQGLLTFSLLPQTFKSVQKPLFCFHLLFMAFDAMDNLGFSKRTEKEGNVEIMLYPFALPDLFNARANHVAKTYPNNVSGPSTRAGVSFHLSSRNTRALSASFFFRNSIAFLVSHPCSLKASLIVLQHWLSSLLPWTRDPRS